MVYLIVPPIIIIISISLLILLLVRRARTVDFASIQTKKEEKKNARSTQDEFMPPSLQESQESQGSNGDTVDAFDESHGTQNVLADQEFGASLKRKARGLRNKLNRDSKTAQESMRDSVQEQQGVENSPKSVPRIQRKAVEKSTLSFIRRRMLLQEQRRNPVSDQDVDIPHDGTHHKNLYDEHESALIAAVAEDPNDITSYTQLGMYYAEKNSYDDARQCFKQILKLQPRNRQAQLMMKKLDQVQS